MTADLREAYDAIRKVGNIFLAFNSNIDNIIHVGRDLEKLADDCIPAKATKLKNRRDLISGIMYSMKHGESMEIPMDRDLEEWVRKNVKPERHRMGGQIGIMANMLSILDVQPVVYTPLLSEDQCRLFSNKVLLMDRGLRHPGSVHRKDMKKTNWIFEYGNGQEFAGREAKKGGRLIASSRIEKFRLKKVDLDFDFGCAILSGFQNIYEKYSDGTTCADQFRIAESIISRIRRKGRPIHIEVAYTTKRRIMKGILEIASLCDSMGFDEAEMVTILEVLGENGLAKRIRSGYDITSVYSGMEAIAGRVETNKIHLHGSGYYLAICKKDYHINPEEVRKAMEFAAVVAAAEAGHGIGKKSDIRTGLRIPVSAEGRKKGSMLAAFLKKEKPDRMHDVVFVPTRMAKKVRDIVGLGDVISACIFAAETGYSLKGRR